jgi:two-component sensor histidine kinase
MKQISYIIIATLMSISATSQVGKEDIHQKLISMGLDSSKLNNDQFSKQLIIAWTKADYESNKYNPYIILPINIWEVLFENQYNKSNEIIQKAQLAISYSTILIDLSKYEKAIPILENAYLSRKKISKSYYNVLLSNLESCYKSKNELSSAIRIRDELIENKLINNYWRIYKACGLTEAAIEDFNLFEERNYFDGNKNIIHPSYNNNLCRLYFQNNKIDSAIKYAEIGLYFVEKAIEDKSIQFLNKKEILLNWKALYIGFLGKCDFNKKYYQKAIPKLQYAINNGVIDIESNTLSMIYLSLCYLNLDNIKSYKIYSDSVRKRMNILDAEDVKRSYYSASYQYFTKINKSDSALHYLQLYTEFKDKVSKGVKQNQSILLLGQLEIQKRRTELIAKNINIIKIEKENTIARNQIWLLAIFIGVIVLILLLLSHFLLQSIKIKKIIDQKNEELNQNIVITNEEIKKNDFLLKELHHRVKNNLQLIYSLLNLQKRRLNDNGTKINLTAVQNRIHTMSLVHEFLYNSDNYEYINVAEYINTLSTHLKTIYKKEDNVEIKYAIEQEIELETERMIFLGLIINEIISNTFKFEIGNGNKIIIDINIQSINGIIEIRIKDNGPGFNKNLVREESLGLKLIGIMCAQLNATHDITVTNGVEHTIIFNFVKS